MATGVRKRSVGPSASRSRQNLDRETTPCFQHLPFKPQPTVAVNRKTKHVADKHMFSIGTLAIDSAYFLAELRFRFGVATVIITPALMYLERWIQRSSLVGTTPCTLTGIQLVFGKNAALVHLNLFGLSGCSFTTSELTRGWSRDNSDGESGHQTTYEFRPVVRLFWVYINATSSTTGTSFFQICSGPTTCG